MKALAPASPVSQAASRPRLPEGVRTYNLLEDFAGLGTRMLVELESALGGESEQAGSATTPAHMLDAYLLAAGMNQILEDYLHLDAFSLNKVAKHLAPIRRPIGTFAAGGALRAGAVLHHLRGGMPRIRQLSARQRALAGLVDRLADEMVRHGSGETLPLRTLDENASERWVAREDILGAGRELLASLTRIPHALARSVVRLPSCFRNFDQHPDDCRSMVEQYAERWPDRSEPIVVIGIRTSGSYLAPLYAAHLRAAGYQHAHCATLRPDRHWYRFEARRFRAWLRKGGRVLLADDPPSSGGAIAKAARQVEHMGVPRRAITLLVPLFGPQESLPAALRVYDVVSLPWEQWSVHERLAPCTVRETLAQLLTDRSMRVISPQGAPQQVTVAAVESCERVPLSPRTRDLTALHPRRGHVRAQYRVTCSAGESNERFTCDVYVKGVGLGYFGDNAEMVAQALHEFCPETYGTVDGLLYRAMLPEENRLAVSHLAHAPHEVERLVDRMASYVAQRRKALPVAEDMSARLAGRDPVWQRGSRILGQPYGRAGLFMRPVLERISRQLLLRGIRHPSVIDGSMTPAQWFLPMVGAAPQEDGLERLLKVDYDERAFSNQDLYCYDAVFDLASAAAHLEHEYGDDSSFGPLLRQHVAHLIPDSVSDERWLLYQLIALQSDTWYYGAVDVSALREACPGSDVHAAVDADSDADSRWIVHQAYLAAERTLTRIFERYMGERYCADIAVPTSGPLCAIDIDGVLESGRLGFTAISPAGALALRALTRHGYRPVLVTGRSLGEVRDRCAAFRLAGGAAEYGAVTYNHATGRIHVTLTAEQRANLDALRTVLEHTDRVMVDPTYRYAVRAYRLDVHGRRRGLKPETIEAVLRQVSSGAQLRPIIGYEQTDFMVGTTDKGAGVRALAEQLDGGSIWSSGGPMLACAVGDTLSDFPMFDLAEHAFAPSNASGDVYDRARAGDAHLRIMRHAEQAGLLDAAVHMVGHHPRRCATCRPIAPSRDAALLLTALSGQDTSKLLKLKQAALLTMRAFMPAPARHPKLKAGAIQMSSPAATSKSPKRILLVLDECHTGETLRAAAYLKAVREHYRSAYIALLTNRHALTALRPEEVCDRVVISDLYGHRFDSVWRVRVHQIWTLVRLAWQLGIGYDLVITYWWGTTLLHLLGCLVAPTGQRIGYARKVPALLTSRLGVFTDDDQAGAHAALLRAAGIQIDRLPPNVSFTEDDAAAMASRLREHGLGVSRTLVVMHVGSDWACQQWLQERWAQLADEVAARYDADIAFTGVASEREYIEDIRRRMRHASVSFAGQTTLPQLAALLTRCSLCVCVDSAAYELTQAVGTPAVVLAGSTAPQDVVMGRRRPVILNLMQPELKAAINTCRVSTNEAGQQRYLAGGCLNYACPMAGLRQIHVDDALGAIEQQARASSLVSRVRLAGEL